VVVVLADYVEVVVQDKQEQLTPVVVEAVEAETHL
tara:strand:+ start:463 stop:567 length:105 start_codon:yes stop_codon:yes gene_type:complete